MNNWLVKLLDIYGVSFYSKLVSGSYIKRSLGCGRMGAPLQQGSLKVLKFPWPS